MSKAEGKCGINHAYTRMRKLTGERGERRGLLGGGVGENAHSGEEEADGHGRGCACGAGFWAEQEQGAGRRQGERGDHKPTRWRIVGGRGTAEEFAS